MKQYVDPVTQFNSMYEIYYAEILGFTRYMVGDRFVAEGLTKEVYIKVWIKLIKFTPITNARAFLYAIAKHICIDYLRYEKRMDEKVRDYEKYMKDELSEQLEDIGYTQEHYQIMYRLVNELPLYLKKVMQLVLWGLDNKQVAEKLQIKVETVSHFRWKALKILKNKVRKNYGRYC